MTQKSISMPLLAIQYIFNTYPNTASPYRNISRYSPLPEIRKLLLFEYVWMPPYLRLCDITQPKLNLQNQIIKGFQEFFLQIFISMFYSSDKQSFSPK